MTTEKPYTLPILETDPLFLRRNAPTLPRERVIPPGCIAGPLVWNPSFGPWATLKGSRKITNVRSSKLISCVWSWKMKAFVSCESRLERDFAFILDWAPGVSQFVAQPPTIAFYLRGKYRRTTPDFGIRLSNDDLVNIEVKTAQKAMDIDLIERSLAAAAAVHSEDPPTTYRVVTDTFIRRQPMLQNIVLLRRYASVVPPLGAEDVLNRVAPERDVPYREVLAAFLGADLREIDLLSLMYWGAAEFDINQPINPEMAIRTWKVTHDAR